MGLDMYAFATAEKPVTEVDFCKAGEVELHYWREHPNLHGWMERLYREKGGRDASFNCVKLVLTAEDLGRLEVDVRARNLPRASGLLFGESDGSEVEDGLRFIAKEAMLMLKNRYQGLSVDTCMGTRRVRFMTLVILSGRGEIEK